MVEAVQKPISDSVQMYLVKIKRLEDELTPCPYPIWLNPCRFLPYR